MIVIIILKSLCGVDFAKLDSLTMKLLLLFWTTSSFPNSYTSELSNHSTSDLSIYYDDIFVISCLGRFDHLRLLS